MNQRQAVREDLDKIVDQAMWAHAHGYSKAGRGLDAEQGTDLSRTEKEREDGPTFDLEIGDHRSRVAYQSAVVAVSRADVTLAALLLLDGVLFQPAVVPLSAYAFPTNFRRCAHRVEWRLDHLEGHDKELAKIHTSFDRVIRGLSKALDHGTVKSALKENPCKTCGIRDRRPKGTECKTCGNWRDRHDGQPRPTRLDSDSINAARAAKTRRVARDEDWGVA